MPSPAAQLFRNARREALLLAFVWLLAVTWAVGYCYLHGYRHAPDDWVVQAGWASVRTGADVTLLLGLPDWIAVGILLPWLLCTVFTAGFCLGMKDDDLGVDVEEGAHGGP